jgi:hypothetical protein
LAEDRRSPDPTAERQQRDLDREVEELTHRVAEVVNSAGAETRQALRAYAIDLLKEETELEDRPVTKSTAGTRAPGFSPLAFALLLGVVSLPLLLLFPPLGLGMFLAALLMGVWGLIDAFVRR